MKTWCWIAIMFACATELHAEEVDLQQLVRDTQITRQHSPGIDLVWWIPTEYWAASLRKSALGPKQQEDLVATVDNYLMVAVLEGTVGTMGVMSSTSKEDLEKKATLVAGETTLSPIPESDLTPAARNFVQVMKPLITNMMGSMGQGMHFLLFSAKGENGVRFVDPKNKGRLTAKIGDKEFVFRLPLGSLLPAMMDANSGERFPGNYEYNPFTGKKLVLAK